MSKTVKKLTRSRDEKWIGGVCGGIADYSGVDANIIRILVVVGTLLGAGSLIVAYIVALFLIPMEEHSPVDEHSPWDEDSTVTGTVKAEPLS